VLTGRSTDIIVIDDPLKLEEALSQTQQQAANEWYELKVLSQQGKEAILAILSVGDFFGEGRLAGQLLCMGTAAGVTDCSLMRLEKSAMIAVLRDEPEFSALFISYLLTRNIRIEEDLVDQLFNSSETRLAWLLLLLANFGKEGKPDAVIPKVSQETLAGMIGTTRSRVSFS
jgi:CRP/FNR family cyclic AMP-dependent transcriptional regulator